MNKDDENKAVQQPAAAEESSQQPAAEQDSGLPKTQEELDALIGEIETFVQERQAQKEAAKKVSCEKTEGKEAEQA